MVVVPDCSRLIRARLADATTEFKHVRFQLVCVGGQSYTVVLLLCTQTHSLCTNYGSTVSPGTA